MWGKSKLKDTKANFVVQIPEYSDAEILNILKKRNHYQPEAARLVISEALKRGLINSEDDLLEKEFRTKPLKKTLFPQIEDKQQKKKISRSITRGLLITGVIPVIFGILKLNEGAQVEGSFVTIGGVLWIIFASKNIRKINLKLLRLLFGILFFCACVSGIFILPV